MFRKDGTVTAGNACPLNDGAAALVVVSDTLAKDLGLTPLARIVSTGVTGAVARDHGPRPGGGEPAGRSRNAGMSIDDIDLVEINEAFAAQVIPSADELGVEWDRLNVHGGAIALGHPFGMTGARITTTLLNALTDEGQDLRPRDDVRRRRPGHGDGDRAPQLSSRFAFFVDRRSRRGEAPPESP